MKAVYTLLFSFLMISTIVTTQGCCGKGCKDTECAADTVSKKMLLIVDAQYDFINGSLAVDGAPAIMDSLARYIASQDTNTYAQIVMTADFHPANHSSFKDYGGIWPVHCVQNTHGGAIYEPVLDAVKKHHADAPILTKGDSVAVDEYSIMANAASKAKLIGMIDSLGIEEIYVAGLCGDYCVGNSIKDLVAAGYGKKIRVLTRFIGNIDDGTTLRTIISENGLKEE